MIRVVLDTSVLVSPVISPTGPNARVFDLIAAGKLRPCLTGAVLAEYHRVFDYERLRHLDRRRVARLRGLREAVSVKVKPSGRLRISTHEEDNRINECAVAGRAHYIVTENAKHFREPYKTTKIVSSRQLIERFEAGIK